jgi:hypothetical protein
MNTTDPTQVTHVVDPGYREDLKRVYLNIHASAITTELPQIATDLKLKRSYVAELVGILENHADNDGNPFVHVNLRAGEENNDTPHDWFSTFHTVDDHTDDDAADWFDRHFPIQETPVPSQKTPATGSATKRDPNPADLPLCLCGCGFPVNNRKRNYRPGHDAKHAGVVARAMAATSDLDKRDRLKDALPTDALKWKAASMADRLIAKGRKEDPNTVPIAKVMEQAKADYIQKVTFETGTVKRGRYSYDAERNKTSGAVTWTDKKGVDQVADEKTAKTFQPSGAEIDKDA